MDHLVIPDCHASPDTNMNRFTWLSNYIVKHKPKKIICLGDFLDMPSLCSYDRGTKGFEGRRYRKDIVAGKVAMRTLMKGIYDYNLMRAANKKKQYKPELIMCLGNHENRINRAVNSDAILEGTISIEDLDFERYGWKVHPFLDVVEVDGIAYTHYFISGVMGRPIGGIHPAASLLSKQHTSATCAHTHILDFAVQTNAVGKKMYALVAGVYDDNHHDYAGRANDLWWRGIIHKYNVKDGEYEPKFISIETLKKEYS